MNARNFVDIDAPEQLLSDLATWERVGTDTAVDAKAA